ncbi:MAG TPA: class I SAM-dependent methyltransferase [bacterium]|nr:class I SAM-dependent methyltransferase [bacterium]
MVLKTDEYGAPYFGDSDTPLRHKAGYTDYAKLRNIKTTIYNPVTKTSTDMNLFNANMKPWLKEINLSGKVLELGCAYGWNRKLGLQINGITDWDLVDVSSFAKTKADIDDQRFFTVQDAKTHLATLPDNSYDHIISFRFIECLTDEDIKSLVAEMNRVCSVSQIHSFSRNMDEYKPYYNTKTLLSWSSSFRWQKGTILFSNAELDVEVM